MELSLTWQSILTLFFSTTTQATWIWPKMGQILPLGFKSWAEKRYIQGSTQWQWQDNFCFASAPNPPNSSLTHQSTSQPKSYVLAFPLYFPLAPGSRRLHILLTLPLTHSLHCSDTGVLVISWTFLAYSHLRYFTLAVPSAYDALPTEQFCARLTPSPPLLLPKLQPRPHTLALLIPS